MTAARGGHEGAFWRRLAHWGANSAPRWFVRSAPVLIGAVLSLVLRRQRRAIQRNWRLMHGSQGWFRENLAIARTFIEFAHCLTEALGAAHASHATERFHNQEPEKWEHIRKSGQGVLIVTAHAGPWDLAAQTILGNVGDELMIVMGRGGNREAEDLQDEVRRKTGVRVVRIGEHSLDALPLLEHLGKGGVAAVQLDRVPPGAHELRGVLFGQSYPVPEGLFRLAGLARVPLVPVFMARLGPGERTVAVGDPVTLPRRPSQHELQEAAQALLSALEAHLRRFPTQWFHFEP